MGLRDAFGRRRGVTPPSPRRHQADPITGELMRVVDDTSGRYTPPEPVYGVPVEFVDTAACESVDDVVDVPATQQIAPPEKSAASEQIAAPEQVTAPAPPAVVLATPTPTPTPTPVATMTEPAPAVVSVPVGGLVLGQSERRVMPDAAEKFYAPSPKPYDRSTVRTAWDLVSDRADVLIRTFYAELFLVLGDDAFLMFPASMTQQREDFGRTLLQWVVTDDPESMSAHLAQLGADHRKFDVVPHHYDLAGTALISAWRRVLGAQWTDEFADAVTASYTRLASLMIDGAQERRAEPASWGATVLEHTRPLGNFAVLRLQPDQPYPFRAGQYLTVELASRSREWRQMSIASAPRPDNTLDIQVRSVNATGVSSALVRHAAAGDRLRLGPPRGIDLVVEPGTLPAGGLLCVCSGTGAAPISAVVEAVAAWPEAPPIYVFVGARTAADLYPAERLHQAVAERGHSAHVQVYGVVSDDAEYTGLRGRVEDVVPTLKDWAQVGVEVLVAGPDAMIAATVSGLVERGVASERIHFDQYEVSG